MNKIRIYQKIEDIPSQKEPRVVVLGNFDGLHLGHQALIKRGADIAKKKGRSLMVFTFFPQFHTIRDPSFRYLLGQEEKFKFLELLGVHEMITVPFEASISSMSPEEFVHVILRETLGAGDVVVGDDYRFGHQAKGDVDFLKGYADQIDVHELDAVMLDGERISSTRVRELLSLGQVDEADRLLGYPYRQCGEVVRGQAIGRTIDFPTANIDYDESLLLPALGVYSAITYLVDKPEKRYLGVLNIGTRPTIDNNPKVIVEVHILDFDENIYGQKLCVEVHHFLRFIEKFHSLEELKAAIAEDVAQTRAFFTYPGLQRGRPDDIIM